MNRITKTLNIVVILTKNRDRKQIFDKTIYSAYTCCLKYGNYDNVIKQKIKKGYKTFKTCCSKLVFKTISNKQNGILNANLEQMQ